MDNDYTVTFPVHLGQTIWVDSTTLPTEELAPDVLVCPYFKAEVRGLKIHMKGDTEWKSIQFRIKARWRVGRNQYATTYKNFSYAISGIGKTIFTKEPQTGKPLAGVSCSTCAYNDVPYKCNMCNTFYSEYEPKESGWV